ncbi:MAG: 30S ribosome-binding factor RbfA [Puniceicoccales bacterium]|jgi:ribosome-binding factor A|nr:30S ribosome-binding factor RbfA [Puniceicoccales bacterium]
MPPRIVRLNKLICRELNALLRTMFRESGERISITDVEVAPDLHDACVYFSVIGDGDFVRQATKFLVRKSKILRRELFQRIRLRCSPRLNFRYDDSIARGQSVLAILDSLQNDGNG